VVKRDPDRPKASDLSDTEVLAAVEDYAMHNGLWPIDAFPEVPGKVILAKMRKLQSRGWIAAYATGQTQRYIVTESGRKVLNG